MKRMEAAGMALTLREKLDLLIFVYEQTCHIYPEEGSNKERSQWVAEQRKAQQNCPPPMDTEEEYYVNDYCSVDFIHVVDEQTQAYVQIKP